MKKILLSLLFLALTAMCVLAALRLTARKDSEVKYGDFFDHAKEIDVLFLGSSHVINGVNPADLYGRTGYTAYNMGGHGSTLPATYWELMLALDYCAPKVVVVDTYMLEKDYQYIDLMYEDSTDTERASSISQLHLNLDVFPLNATKKAAVTDLISDNGLRWQFYYPELLYHTRWSELTAQDYAFASGQGARNPFLGCELRYGVETREEPPKRIGDGASMEKATVGVSYLNRIVETCQERDIGVLLTCLPLYGNAEDEKAAAGARLIAEHYGVPFVNYYEDAFPAVDVHADFHDHGHLNITGCEKVTAVLGTQLQSCFGEEAGSIAHRLADHRGDDSYAFFASSAEAYQAERAEALTDQTDLYTQLNLLEHADTGAVVFVRFQSDAARDRGLLHLIDNLRRGMDGSVAQDIPLSERMEDTDSYLLVRDTTGEMWEAVGTTPLTIRKTVLGALSYAPQDIYCALTSDAAPDQNLLDMEAGYDADVQILLYDDSGEVFSHSCYYLNAPAYEVH